MTSAYEPLIPAVLAVDADGRPVSPRFRDIYYAGDDPLAQAREVFLAGNALPQRWQGRSQFTVLETGFGLGHNFLALWQAWRDDGRRCQRLHMVSVEAHPFLRADLEILLGRLQGPEQQLACQLLAAWPLPLPGIHRLEFEQGAVTLTLAFGRIERMARQLDLGFDACFLDGFAPRVNPEMWTPAVFGQLARLARRDATLATWCSAGHVRRGLQNAGFLVTRLPGFGSKRHRVEGRLRPGMGQRLGKRVPSEVLVIGSGFAGAAAARALTCRGHAVTVLDPALAAGMAGTHRGHRGAVMSPPVSRDDDIRSRLGRAGVLLAEQRWRALVPDALARCGAFRPVPADGRSGWRRALAHLQFPAQWLLWLEAQQARERLGVAVAMDGLWLGHAYAVQPERLVTGLLASPLIRTQAATVERLARKQDGRWEGLDFRQRVVAQADQVVLANAWMVPRLLQSIHGVALPSRIRTMGMLAGQLSYFPSVDGGRPDGIIEGATWCMPDGGDGVIGGSTYVRDTTLSIITGQGHHENRKNVATLLGIQPTQLGWPRAMADGWAGWRATVRDRLPVIGPVAALPGLWLACGFGSRGLTWSALGAELLAARLNHEPIPLERELVRKIAPC